MRIRQPGNISEGFDIPFLEGKRFDLVGFGQNTVDDLLLLPEFPRFDSKVEILHHEVLPGGQIATALLFAARMGLKCAYIGAAGMDDAGRRVRDALARASIDVGAFRFVDGARTHHSIILVDQSSGERTILWERDPRLGVAPEELSREACCDGRVLLLDASDVEAALQAARWAREEGIPVVLDIDRAVEGSRELIGQVDFLIASSSFAAELTSIAEPMEALRELRNYCGGFLAATLGERGAIAIVGDECLMFTSIKVRALDTTGAGDIFHGAFVFGLLQNWPVGKIMAFANAAAGLSCTAYGAHGGIMRLPEILARILSD